MIKCALTGLVFQIDIGAEISTIPVSCVHNPVRTSLTVTTANGSCVATYGFHTMCIDIGLQKQYNWQFLVADLPQPYLALDFLAHFDLSMHPKNRKIFDSSREIAAFCIMTSDVNNNVLALARDSKPIKHLSRHVIETSGLSVVQKFLQVHIDTLTKVK